MVENKIAFVKELGRLLAKYSRAEIHGCDYEYDFTDRIDFAVITFRNTKTKKRVNITGDSVIAIMADIYKALC